MITAKVISAIEVPRLNKFVNEELKAFLIMCEIESVGGFALRNTLLEFPVYADYWIMGKESKHKATYLHLSSPIYCEKGEPLVKSPDLALEKNIHTFIKVSGYHIEPKIKYDRTKERKELQTSLKEGVIYTIKRPLITEMWVVETEAPRGLELEVEVEV